MCVYVNVGVIIPFLKSYSCLVGAFEDTGYRAKGKEVILIVCKMGLIPSFVGENRARINETLPQSCFFM